jgi:hypothetical protein
MKRGMEGFGEVRNEKGFGQLGINKILRKLGNFIEKIAGNFAEPIKFGPIGHIWHLLKRVHICVKGGVNLIEENWEKSFQKVVVNGILKEGHC